MEGREGLGIEREQGMEGRGGESLKGG